MLENQTPIGLRLKELREAAGLTQPQLAERTGLSRAGVAHIEQGLRRPTWDTITKLAAALGVTPDAFSKPPSADVQPRGRGRPPKGQADIPTAAPQRRTGRKMPGRTKRPGKGE
jgi:transcriptional regulator with XRE-family HTH domain